MQKCIHHSLQYHQNNLKALMPATIFLCTTTTSVFPLKYMSNLFCPAVYSFSREIIETRRRGDSGTTECLHAIQGAMRHKFKKGVKDTSYSKVVTRCSLIVRPYPTTSPGSKIDHEWLRPFSLSWCIQTLAYHLTFFLSVEGVHQLIQVSLLQNHKMIQIRDREIILLT